MNPTPAGAYLVSTTGLSSSSSSSSKVSSSVSTTSTTKVTTTKVTSTLAPSSSRSMPLTALTPRPIPNSYWATPFLLACEYPWTPRPRDPARPPKLDSLLRAGVRTFIDLTESGELSPYAGAALSSSAAALDVDIREIEYHRFPIRDRSLPSSYAALQTILSVLASNESQQRICAVHCRGGIGRTGMVVGCWLVESGRAQDGEDALRIIAREWCTVEKCKRYPHSPETGAQFEFVRRFEAGRLKITRA